MYINNVFNMICLLSLMTLMEYFLATKNKEIC